MANPYVIKMTMNCNCQECNDMLENLRKIDGVQLEMDEQRKVTILITKNLKIVTKKLDEHGKWFELSKNAQSELQKPVQELQKPISKYQMYMTGGQSPAPETNKAKGSEESRGAEQTEKIAQKDCCCPKCKHKMELKSYKRLFQCHGCNEKGFGERYRCDDCGYELHEVCMSPENPISPEIYRGYSFEFESSPPTTPRNCDACAKVICGHFYRCHANKLGLHPCCGRNLKAEFSNFKIHNNLSSSSSSLPKCKRCDHRSLLGDQNLNAGCSYVSTCNKDRFHVYCITEMVHETWKTGDINGATDDFVEALENFNLEKHGDNSNKKGVRSGGSGFWDTVSMIVSTIAACLLGNPIAVLVPLFSGLFLKSVPKLLKY